MGWGLELDLRKLRPEGCLLGIVDAVRIAHVGIVAAEYDKEAQMRRMRSDLAELGVRHWNELQLTLGTWRAWRRMPPWQDSLLTSPTVADV
jgi:hypothetical protein